MLLSTDEAKKLVDDWGFQKFHVPIFGVDSEQLEYTDMWETNTLYKANAFVSASLTFQGKQLHQPMFDIDAQYLTGIDRPMPKHDCPNLNTLESIINYFKVEFQLEEPYWWNSSTPGNFHLVYNESMPWAWYKLLLYHCAQQLYIVQAGWYRTAMIRKKTTLRLPGVTK